MTTIYISIVSSHPRWTTLAQTLLQTSQTFSFLSLAILIMSIQNLIGLLRHAGEYSSGRGVTVYSPTIKNGFSSISYQTLLLLARERSIQLQMQENLDNKVVLMHFTEHLDGIVWFWAIVASGGIPCICPPLARDLDQRRKNVKHLQDLLRNPLVITTQFLATEFPSLEGLRVVATGKHSEWSKLCSFISHSPIMGYAQQCSRSYPSFCYHCCHFHCV